jgi:hypothetical protein
MDMGERWAAPLECLAVKQLSEESTPSPSAHSGFMATVGLTIVPSAVRMK